MKAPRKSIFINFFAKNCEANSVSLTISLKTILSLLAELTFWFHSKLGPLINQTNLISGTAIAITYRAVYL